VTKKKQVESKPLETRHAFLDTQVYHKLKHNAANRALAILAEHVAEHRLVLHVTDITLLEVKRQIAEEVEKTRTALARIEKDLTRWRHTVSEIGPVPVLDGVTAERLFSMLDAFLVTACRVKKHEAMAPVEAVFADYFARKPPFDKGSKEFPDAFALKALEAWCANNNESMYVVTQDAAMQRHVDDSPYLLLLPSIEELLASASGSAELDGNAEAIADALLNAPEFDSHLEEAIDSHIDELILDYQGDLPKGEVTDVKFEGVIQFLDFRIVARSSNRISLVVSADTEITADVVYEDRRLAMYDSEDGVWIGADWESTEVANSIALEMYIELEIATGCIVTSELLRTEYPIN
jgi:hypothetical protein